MDAMRALFCVKLAKAIPGQLNYGSAGNASPAHLAGAMFDLLAGVKTAHVPYKGAAQALTDVIADVVKVLNLPEVNDRLAQQGIDRVGNSPAEAAVYLKSETIRWAKVIKAANMRAD